MSVAPGCYHHVRVGLCSHSNPESRPRAVPSGLTCLVGLPQRPGPCAFGPWRSRSLPRPFPVPSCSLSPALRSALPSLYENVPPHPLTARGCSFPGEFSSCPFCF